MLGRGADLYPYPLSSTDPPTLAVSQLACLVNDSGETTMEPVNVQVNHESHFSWQDDNPAFSGNDYWDEFAEFNDDEDNDFNFASYEESEESGEEF